MRSFFNMMPIGKRTAIRWQKGEISFDDLRAVLTRTSSELKRHCSRGRGLVLHSPKRSLASYLLLLSAVDDHFFTVLTDEQVDLQKVVETHPLEIVVTHERPDFLTVAFEQVSHFVLADCTFYIHRRRHTGEAPTRAAGLSFTTSGSTGPSKIAVHDLSSSLLFADHAIAEFGLDYETKMLTTASTSWDVIVEQLIAPLLIGGTVVVPGEGAALNPLALSQIINEMGANTLILSQFMFTTLQRYAPVSHLANLRTVVFSGERIFSQHQLIDRFPQVRFFSEYGCSEAHDVASVELNQSLLSRQEIPLGRPWPTVNLHTHLLCELPSALPRLCHDVGIMRVSGPMVMNQYLQSSELTWFDLPDYIGYNNSDSLYYAYGRKQDHISAEMTVLRNQVAGLANYCLDLVDPVPLPLSVIDVNGEPSMLAHEHINEGRFREILGVLRNTFSNIPISDGYWLLRKSPKTRHGKIDFREVERNLTRYAQHV